MTDRSVGLPKYYDAEQQQYITISTDFDLLLARLAATKSGRKALEGALSWIDTALQAVGPQVKFTELMTEYLKKDADVAKATAEELAKSLLDYNNFRQLFAGLPNSTELTAYFESAEMGIETKVAYQGALKFRSNANLLLTNREEAKKVSGGSSSTAMQTQLKSFGPLFGFALSK